METYVNRREYLKSMTSLNITHLFKLFCSVSVVLCLHGCQKSKLDFDYMLTETFGDQTSIDYTIISSSMSPLFLNLLGVKQESYLIGVNVEDFDSFMLNVRDNFKWKPQPPPGFEGDVFEWERIKTFDRYDLTLIARVNEVERTISVFIHK